MSGQLFSCSSDKQVKVWDVESRSYVETLFGHQDTVQAIDANTRERAITAGGRDNTIRIFKIPEETQLLYRYKFYIWVVLGQFPSRRQHRNIRLLVIDLTKLIFKKICQPSEKKEIINQKRKF